MRGVGTERKQFQKATFNIRLLPLVKKMRQERVVVSNLSEAFIDFLNKDTHNKGSLLDVELTLDDQAVLWEGDNSLIIASHKVAPPHMRHLQEVLEYTNIEVLSPNRISGRLSQDVASDQDLLLEVADRTRLNPQPTYLTPYCVTSEFISLVDILIQHGANITIPEVPTKGSLWVVKSIDLKSGFRRLCREFLQTSPIRIPRGFSCDTLDQVVTMAYQFSKTNTPCIIKPVDGEDGIGQSIIPAAADLNFILSRVNENPFIQGGDAVVEEYIESDPAVRSPSIEYRIRDGKLEYMYSCKQILSPTGTFLGVDIGPELLPREIKTQMVRAGHAFGNALAALGYKGFFDIDFIVSKDQKVYAVETNLRRTGATHVHATASRLFGSNYESSTFLRSSDVDPCIAKTMSCEDVFLALNEILYPHLGTDRGVIITVSAGISDGRLGYIVTGKSSQEISRLQDELHKRLS